MSVNDSPPGLLPADTVTPDLANIIFPSLPLHQYHIIGILHKTQEAGRKYILFYFEIYLASIFAGQIYCLYSCERRGGENSPLTSH